jgi:hypothetical protein
MSEEQMARVRPSSRRFELMLMAVFAGALGVTLWCLGIHWTGENELSVFLPGSALAVALLVTATRFSPASVAAPMGALPCFAAYWTAPRGEGDGTWVTIFPILAGWTAVLIVLAVGIRWLTGRMEEKWESPAADDAMSNRFQLSAVAGVIIVALAVAGAASSWSVAVAGPWEEMQAQISTYSVPQGFMTIRTERHGDQRCTRECTPEVRLLLRSTLGAGQSCQALEDSLRRWPGTSSVSTSSPIVAPESGYWEVCLYVATQRHAGHSREVQAIVSVPPGKPVDVTVSLFDHCAITC